MSDTFQIEVPDSRGTTGVAYPASGNRRLGTTLLLGHGAGAGQHSPWIVEYARGLAGRGLDVVTFNFLYAEHGRRVPDRNDVLEACYRAAIAAARTRLPANRVALGGKSMGGRIATQVTAQFPGGGAGDLAGLVLLGYPLHPPGKPQQLRASHLPAVKVPMLFVQGSRDAFGSPAELGPVLEPLGARATLYPIEGGDHSLKLPKGRASLPGQDTAGILNRIVEWLSDL
jgi:predicted alpha/beta-hydrolase family hydrolase